MKSKLVYGLLLGAITAFATMTPVMAATSQDTLYDEGRAYNNQLNDSTAYNGYSTVVLSASANYYSSGGWGRERIRAWGRLDTINDEYSYPNYTNGIEQINTEFYSAGPSLMMTQTNPITNLVTYTIPSFVYDILGYLGLPSNTIQAWTNNIVVSGTQVVQNQAYDYNINYLGPDPTIANLPNSISYSDCDQELGSQDSGVQSMFQYNLPNTDYNYSVNAAASVEYSIYDNYTDAPVYFWTNNAIVTHTVNTQ